MNTPAQGTPPAAEPSGSRGAGARPAWLEPAALLAIAGVCVWIVYRLYHRLAIDQKPYVDFDAFYYGAKAILDGEDPYLVRKKMYIYPPLLAVLMAPLAALEILRAAWIWLFISMAGTGAAVWLFVRALAERLLIPMNWRLYIVILGAALVCYVDRFRWEFENEQTDWILVLGFGAGLLWMDKRPALAGLGLGLAANIKYTALIMVPYYLLRRRWAAAGWTVLGTALWALAPALVLGWGRNIHYLTTALAGIVAMLGIQVEHEAANVTADTWVDSVSIGSLAARFAEYNGMGLGGKLGLMGLAGAGALGAAWLIYRAFGVPLFARRGGRAEAGLPVVAAAEYCGLVVVSVIFVPQMMARHAFITLPALLLGLMMILNPRPGVRMWPAIAGIALAILGLVLPPGGKTFYEAEHQWRTVAGPSWCLLAMFLGVLYTALSYQRAISRGSISAGAKAT